MKNWRSNQFRQDVERAKARFDLSHIVGRHVKLRKAGNEHVGLCPFHNEKTPSFRVNDAKGVFHCFGCGARGDAIDFIMNFEGREFVDAVAILLGEEGLPEAAPRDRAALVRQEKADRAAAVLAAQAEWQDTLSIKGTPAELYLASRGITADVPATARYGRVALWRDKKTGASGRRCSALVLGAQDRRGKIVGIQSIFLTEDGQKADMANPKVSLGQIRGSAVRLAPPEKRIILTEGPEDGLTLRMKSPKVPVWITLGTGSMPYVDLPDEVEHVTLAGDNNAAGRAAVERAAEEYEAQGKRVDAIFPDRRYEDWNDEHRGIRMKK
ncbi:DNA primase [Sphingobium lactosutens]|uniref:CHC2 zinc finger domain-containing protein n=1 Tax=Sphingobium lactosutens TaxID=522773 RepID=UPI0015BD09D4|nr:CHC2 zinc finger domain-containing protein [Sphingobium lactosutens]NWK99191.1 DNA primase [Sphingobium lactosutens]